ncbi:MAG: hypothetical protein FJ145_24230 [Deltaproteobacteria bacterium]|nr:hypothetical protein [Deltaproteobacteria bacterium]
MSNRLEEIARRKRALIERCAEERAQLSNSYRQIHSPLQLSTALVGVSRVLKTYPLLAAGISSLLVSGYGSKLTRSAADLLKLWRMVVPVWVWLTKRDQK